ncbi:AraC family transcriptional regulator [Burkholderia thailandensis]|nr:AraC family transcriptional regulator [Burkholderia thailandensis]AWY62522.1 AraC family transcriptional regulator [Burkholderia thailandensis]AWY64568.1 AraC family transcriptional regulator [Burkholderia thailandensis]NOK42279.1 AraC family transcriptional regulator [Burkholderia thailandensis]NOK53740.1 AraC family transcriptional regulator [Burkholderia thailandensis]
MKRKAKDGANFTNIQQNDHLDSRQTVLRIDFPLLLLWRF